MPKIILEICLKENKAFEIILIQIKYRKGAKKHIKNIQILKILLILIQLIFWFLNLKLNSIKIKTINFGSSLITNKLILNFSNKAIVESIIKLCRKNLSTILIITSIKTIEIRLVLITKFSHNKILEYNNKIIWLLCQVLEHKQWFKAQIISKFRILKMRNLEVLHKINQAAVIITRQLKKVFLPLPFPYRIKNKFIQFHI